MRTAFLLLPVVLLAACVGNEQEAPETTDTGEQSPVAPIAVAVLEPVGDGVAGGTVTFEATDDGVDVSYDVQGLSAGRHGFHVHENGSCEAGEDGTPGGAAGGHFNPGATPHGRRDTTAEARHVGDLGNIEAGENGTSQGMFVDDVITLEGEHSIGGKAMLIHGGEDDLASQPSGDAGARIACGIIELQ